MDWHVRSSRILPEHHWPESGPEQMSSLMKLWIVVCGDQGDSTGRELDDLIVVCGNDDSGLNIRKIRDLITLGRSAVAESATEVFSCAYEACSAWDVLVPNHENGTLTTGQKYVAEYDVDNDLSDFGPRLSRKTHYTLIKFSVQRKVAEANCLSFGTYASELSKGDTTGRKPDDRVAVRGHDVSGQNAWKTRDLITLGSSAVAVSATEVFSCAYVACSAWDGSV